MADNESCNKSNGTNSAYNVTNHPCNSHLLEVLQHLRLKYEQHKLANLVYWWIPFRNQTAFRYRDMIK